MTQTPPALTRDPAVTFRFTSDVASATFVCSLDAVPFSPCSSPHNATVDEGTHTFAVAAVAGGQQDDTPATWTFRLDLTPPNTIDAGPPDATGEPDAGTPDAIGEPDAGAPDATGQADANVVDAMGQPDGAPDAPQPRTLIVTRTGTGQGTVISTMPSGINCGGVCAGDFLGTVKLEATPSPGSYFRNWAGACAGAHRRCEVDMSADRAVFAEFALIERNLVFATSETYQGDFGGPLQADMHCKRLAEAAGLFNTSGSPLTWVAFVNDATTSAVARLGGARGFVRMDGAPIGDTVASITTINQVWHPIRYDENGAEMPEVGAAAWTGNSSEATNCSSWSRIDAYGDHGLVNGGPVLWMNYENQACAMRYHIYCMMTDKTVPLTLVPATGKQIYVTSQPFETTLGISEADRLCDAEKPAGVTSARALLSTTQKPAGDLLVAGSRYVRPDGVLVGTGADLIDASRAAGRPLSSGIWQRGDGTYVHKYFVITGSTAVDQVGANMDHTCADWAATQPRQAIMGSTVADRWFWNHRVYQCQPESVYCVEQ